MSVTAEALHQEVEHTLDVVYKLRHKKEPCLFLFNKVQITYQI